MRGMWKAAVAIMVVGLGACSGTENPTAPVSRLEAPPTANVGTDSQPTVWTDKDDYIPRELVGTYGSGWLPGETVVLTYAENPVVHPSKSYSVVADSLGNFEAGDFAPDDHHLGISFILTAVGQTSGRQAQTTFTDAIVPGPTQANNNTTGTAGTPPPSSQITIATPTAAGFPALGDLLVAQIVVSNAFGSAVICPPTGWTSILRTNLNGSSATIALETFYYKVTSLPVLTSFVWQFRTNSASCGTNTNYRLNTGASGGIAIYQGVDPTTPLDVAPLGASGSSSGPYRAPSITTVTNGAQVLRFFGAFKALTSTTGIAITPTANRLWNVGSTNNSAERTAAAFHVSQSTAGSTGTFDATFGASAEWAAQTVALRMAPPSNTAPTLTDVPAGPQSIPELALYTFDANATDPGAPPQTLTFSLVGTIPSGAAIDPSTGVFTWTPTEAQGPSGPHTFTVRVSDGTANTDQSVTLNVTEVNVAPTLTGVPTTAQSIPELALYTFDANASDTDLPAQTLTFSIVGSLPSGATFNTTTGVFEWTPTEAQGPSGPHSFTVRVSDGMADTDQSVTLNVTDVNAAPVLGPIGAKTVDEGSTLTFTASGTDGDVPAQTLTYSLDAGAPAGATINASTGAFSWTPTDGPTQSTSITVRVTDDATPALSDFETIAITVNNVAPSIVTPLTLPASPVAMGSNFSMSWTFTDPGSDTWTCKISWDQPVVLGTGFASSGKTCSISGSGLAAGVYTVTVYVEDDDGGSDQETATAYIVVYDPNGGFVTGGGWFYSEAGNYRLDADAEGKAHFGFVSKYQPGRTLPQGHTEFQFQAGDLNFKSTVYEWLVVAGTKAMYKGEGTIAGRTGVYGFLLSAIDGSPDKFRIKIWEKTSGTIVYDTLPVGAADDADPSTILGGGSIVVHTKK